MLFLRVFLKQDRSFPSETEMLGFYLKSIAASQRWLSGRPVPTIVIRWKFPVAGRKPNPSFRWVHRVTITMSDYILFAWPTHSIIPFQKMILLCQAAIVFWLNKRNYQAFQSHMGDGWSSPEYFQQIHSLSCRNLENGHFLKMDRQELIAYVLFPKIAALNRTPRKIRI